MSYRIVRDSNPKNARKSRARDSGLVNGTGLFSQGIGTAAYEARATASHARGIANINRPIWTRPATVKPGGERFQTRFADMTTRAGVIADGIRVIKAARDVAEKTGNAELAALANNPKLMKAIDAAIKRLGRDADSILRTTLATSNDDPEAQAQSFGSGSVNTPHNSNDPSAVSGQDSAFTAWTPEAAAQREASQRRLNAMHATLELGSEQDKARALFGMPPASDDNPYATFEGK